MYRGWLHPLWLCITGFALSMFMAPIAVNRVVPLLQAPFSSVYNTLQALQQVSYGRDLVTATVILADNISSADVVMYAMNDKPAFCPEMKTVEIQGSTIVSPHGNATVPFWAPPNTTFFYSLEANLSVDHNIVHENDVNSYLSDPWLLNGGIHESMERVHSSSVNSDTYVLLLLNEDDNEISLVNWTVKIVNKQYVFSGDECSNVSSSSMQSSSVSGLPFQSFCKGVKEENNASRISCSLDGLAERTFIGVLINNITGNVTLEVMNTHSQQSKKYTYIAVYMGFIVTIGINLIIVYFRELVTGQFEDPAAPVDGNTVNHPQHFGFDILRTPSVPSVSVSTSLPPSEPVSRENSPSLNGVNLSNMNHSSKHGQGDVCLDVTNEGNRPSVDIVRPVAVKHDTHHLHTMHNAAVAKLEQIDQGNTAHHSHERKARSHHSAHRASPTIRVRSPLANSRNSPTLTRSTITSSANGNQPSPLSAASGSMEHQPVPQHQTTTTTTTTMTHEPAVTLS